MGSCTVHVIAPDHGINETRTGRKPAATAARILGRRTVELGSPSRLGENTFEAFIVRSDRFGRHAEGKVIWTEN